VLCIDKRRYLIIIFGLYEDGPVEKKDKEERL
jgi:hypothetical protein